MLDRKLIERVITFPRRRYQKLRGFLDVRYNYRRPLVNVQELGREVNKALSYLKRQFGTEKVGDYLEFGVCQGTSLLCVNSALERYQLGHVHLYGFDSFDGLPRDEEGFWKTGDFNSEYLYTRHQLTEGGVDWNRTHLIKGWFEDTLNAVTAAELELERCSLVMVDCDLYASSLAALRFCAPLLTETSIIIFDDWNPLAARNMGEKRAFAEFLAENPSFSVAEFGNYSYSPGDGHGKLFIVRHTG